MRKKKKGKKLEEGRKDDGDGGVDAAQNSHTTRHDKILTEYVLVPKAPKARYLTGSAGQASYLP